MRKLAVLSILTFIAVTFSGCVVTNRKPANNDGYMEDIELSGDKINNNGISEESGNKTEQENEMTVQNAYMDILRQIYDALEFDAQSVDDNNEYYSIGIHEIAMYLDTPSDRRKAISYCILDINQDGIEELLIVDSNDNGAFEMRILDMYTWEDGTAIKVIEGWSRNRFYLLDDGTIYNEGSGGAAYSIMQLFVFEPRGTELTEKDLYFTYPKNENMDETGYYYSKDGIYDVSQAIEITAEECHEVVNTWQERIIKLEMKTIDTVGEK